MSNHLDQFEDVYAKDLQEWSQWLSKNHESSPRVWLIYYKKNSEKHGFNTNNQWNKPLYSVGSKVKSKLWMKNASSKYLPPENQAAHVQS